MTTSRRKSRTRTTSTDERLDPVRFYCDEVLAGRIVAGPYVRAACRRHLGDLATGKARGLVWKNDEALRVLGFFEDVLRLPTSERDDVTGAEVVQTDNSRPFRLHISQKFILGSLFGWFNADGTRRFRVAFIEIGKGNGKSPLAAGIGLYMLTADGQQSAEVYAAAAVKDQAKIQYRDAVQMVDASEDLAEILIKHGEKEVYNLVNRRSKGFFKPISAEKRGLDGKRVHCALLDELHEHPSDVVANKMRAGTKGMRNALIVEITNSGVDRQSVCYQHHEYGIRVVEGATVDESFFAYICALDEGDDPLTDPKCWPKANPLLGVTITERYLRELVVAARGMPAQESIVRRLNFCEWVDAANPWISGPAWRAGEVMPDAADLADLLAQAKKVEPVGAIDLSGARDLTALALAWDLPDCILAMLHFFTPKDTLVERAKRDRVPYDVWVKGGFITATPGRAVDMAFVAHRLREIQTETGLGRLAFDPYRIKYLEKELDAEKIELELVAHGQGYYKAAESGLWMPRSIERLEEHIFAGNPEAPDLDPAAEADPEAEPRKPAKPIRVIFNPAMRYCAASTVTEADAKENRIFTKRKSKGRIDGTVALAMVCGLLELDPAPGIPDDYMPAFA